MFSFSKPAIAQNQILPVKKLCENLGFGHSYDRPESNIRESTQTWRKQYRTREGILGRNLIEWRQQTTQRDLKSMTNDYLEKGGYGMKHWPANTIGIPEYPKDRHQITELLMQLFWRENNNEAHNAKHPRRGRRVRENIDSDQSSMAQASPTVPEYPPSNHPSAQVPPQSVSKPAYPGIGVGSIPKGPFSNTVPRSDLSFNQANTREHQNAASPAQSSGSLFVPLIADTEQASTTLQSSLPTLIGDSTESVGLDIPDDVYDWGDDGLTRLAKDKASKRTKSSIMHPWKGSEDGGTAASVAPLANMRTSPRASPRTPKKAEPEQMTPPSKSASGQASHQRSLGESSRRRRGDVDVDGDDEDAEYIPRPRSKRQKATTNGSDDAPIVPEPLEPENEALPTRTRPPAADGECPYCFTVLPHITDGSFAARESHIHTCMNSKLHSSPSAPAPEAQQSDTMLPSRPRRKRAGPAAPVAPEGHDDMIANAAEFLSSDELPHQLQRQGINHAERSLPSPASNLSLSENISPGPHTPTENTNARRNISTPKPPTFSRRAKSPTWNDDPYEQRQQQSAQPHLTPKPEIRYYIIASRQPRFSKIHWPEGSLTGKTVEAIFDEVLDVASKSSVHRIAFKLNTSVSDIQYTITRNDDKIFEVMKKAFSKDINADLGRGNADFDIELELDPGISGVPVAAEENSVDFGFSF